MSTGNSGIGQAIARASSFRLDITDDKIKNLGLWTQASGLDVNWTVAEYKPGDTNEIWVCSGRPKYSNLTLVRPVCKSSKNVQKWLRDTSRDTKPCSAVIALVDEAMVGTEGDSSSSNADIITWHLRACFPVSWTITGFDANKSNPVMETLKLVHSGYLDDPYDFRTGKE